jgi:RNA polymerase sigma factor (sigma-70 family)
MAGPPLNAILTRLRENLKPQPDSDISDADLLSRFVAERDEAAFEALVWRHGPMVLAVCRRVLGDAADTEDAFQAAFLVLVRRARAIGTLRSLAGWLHGVAVRVAFKARARLACRRRHEGGAMPPDPPATADPMREVDWDDLRPVLDAELDRLPDKFRVPIVLCHLEGKTQQEVAELLGWPVGTVATRVRRGHVRLRSRLTRRGVALSAAGLEAVFAQTSAAAAPGPELVGLTVKQAALVLAGGAAAVASHLQRLVTGVVRTMSYSTITKAGLVALLVVLIGTAGLIFRHELGQAAASAPVAAQQPAPAPVPAAEPEKEKRADAVKKDLKALEGVWTMTAMEFGKTTVPAEKLEGYKYTFIGEKLTWDGPRGITVRTGMLNIADGVFNCTIAIDPSEKPKQIDITLPSLAKDKGDAKILGIYEIEGDSLKICFSSGGRRPTQFSSVDEPRAGNMVLKRAPPRPAVDAEKRAEAIKKDTKALEGVWTVSAMEFGKTTIPAEKLTGYKYTFMGDKVTWDGPRGITVKSGQLFISDGVFNGTFTVDPTEKPKQIDMTLPSLAKDKGDRKIMAIYELDGDALKICFSSFHRPHKFSPKDEPRWGCVELKRAKK